MTVKLMTSQIKLGHTSGLEEITRRVLGESNEQLVKTASKEEVKIADAVEKKDQGKPSGQPQWEGKKENVNCPEKCDGKKPAVKKEEKKETKVEENKDTKKEAKVEDKKDKKEEEKKDDKKMETKKDEEKKCASNSRNFVKIAKLNEKTRSMLKAYWTTLYPAEYVEAMLAEK
jgi:hypothetical protein